MTGVMMNELESNIVQWVSDVEKNGRHSRAIIIHEFINKGYPFNDIEAAIDNMLKQNVIQMNDGWVDFVYFDDKASVENVLPYDKLVQEVLNQAGSVTGRLPAVQNPEVHSPSHYTRGGIEVIDFIEAKGLNFHLGNVVKYVSRAGFKKDAKVQDLEKAMWYLTREINRIKASA